MCHRIQFFLVFILLLIGGCWWGVNMQDATAAESAWVLRAAVPLAEKTWRWNWASWDQEKIVTFGEYQYTVFWDADGVFVLARRHLADNTVQLVRMPGWRLSVDDAHRNTCLGISEKDGRLHFSWDHHNNPLNYGRTRAGFLTQPPAQISAGDFEPRQPPAEGDFPMSRVTYPRFINDNKGGLYLFYREGGSGNGDNYLWRYDAETGRWTMVGCVFSKRGTYAPWNNSTSRNAYFHDLLFDRNNRLHATWVYREVAETWASNHDLHYAYSDDGGATWFNNSGEKIADMSADDPIELNDAGIVVREIPVFSWLMNAGCMALDSKGRPHVMTFKLPEPREPNQLKHDPPDVIRHDLRFVHYWRDDDGTWHGGEPIHPINGDIPGESVARGDIVFGPDDTLFFYWVDRNDGRFRYLVAFAADQWQSWRVDWLLDKSFSGGDASKHDRRRWQNEGVLSFTARFGDQGFGIVDLKMSQGAAP